MTELQEAIDSLAAFEVKKTQMSIQEQVDERKNLARNFVLFHKIAIIVQHLGQDQYHYSDEKIRLSYDFQWNSVSAYFESKRVFDQQNDWIDLFIPTIEFLTYIEELFEQSKIAAAKKKAERDHAKDLEMAQAFGLEVQK